MAACAKIRNELVKKGFAKNLSSGIYFDIIQEHFGDRPYHLNRQSYPHNSQSHFVTEAKFLDHRLGRVSCCLQIMTSTTGHL